MHRRVRIDLDRLDGYRARLREFVSDLKRRFPIRRVLLFGSFARGEDDVHEMSDIDLVVIGEIDGRFAERIGKVRALTDLPIEPLVYTETEWAEMLADENSFLEEIARTGVEL